MHFEGGSRGVGITWEEGLIVDFFGIKVMIDVFVKTKECDFTVEVFGHESSKSVGVVFVVDDTSFV